MALFGWLAVAGPGPVPPVRTEPVSILWEEGVKNAYPHWSRDGSRILYQSNRGGAWQLHVMDRDGSHAEALTEGSSNSNFPDWSPDNPGLLLIADLANPTLAGLERYGDTQLYVSRGAGAWGPPVRVGAPSDITLVELASYHA